MSETPEQGEFDLGDKKGEPGQLTGEASDQSQQRTEMMGESVEDQQGAGTEAVPETLQERLYRIRRRIAEADAEKNVRSRARKNETEETLIDHEATVDYLDATERAAEAERERAASERRAVRDELAAAQRKVNKGARTEREAAKLLKYPGIDPEVVKQSSDAALDTIMESRAARERDMGIDQAIRRMRDPEQVSEQKEALEISREQDRAAEAGDEEPKEEE